MELRQGRLSQLWAAAGAKKDELVNGGFYMPIGKLSNDRLDNTAKSQQLAEDLWTYTQDVLAKVWMPGHGEPRKFLWFSISLRDIKSSNQKFSNY